MTNTAVINVQELMKDKTFVEQVLGAETAEAAQELFASRGVDFTMEEIIQIGEGLKAASLEGELDAADLDAVAGGIALETVAAVVSIVAGGVTIVDFIGKRAGWWK